MKKLVTVAQMRALEASAAARGVAEAALMEQAGRAAADVAGRMPGGIRLRRIVVLVGPGNNGGDGLVAARHLQRAGARVTCALVRPRGEDPNFRAAVDAGVDMRDLDDPTLFDYADIVLDALLGTGRARLLDGPIAAVLGRVGDVRASPYGPGLLALDLPTGVDADTGAVDPCGVAADRTVVFGYGKIGLYVEPGASFAGEVEVVDIGLPADVATEPNIELLDDDWLRGVLPPRPATANKGTFGRALVAAGSVRYTGAAALATMAALRTGAGLVTLACPQSVQPMLAANLWESTYLPLSERDGALWIDSAAELLRELPGYDALLVGPGIGQTPETRAFVGRLLPALDPETTRVVVLDADALNAMARIPDWQERLTIPAVLTPHPGEMARLLSCEVADVQADRLAAATDAAKRWGQVVVLKGANTIVASPDGRTRLSSIATPALATAGTGDVLAGAILALLAQGLDPCDAASAAVWLHGRAGMRVEEGLGERGAVAGDVLAQLPLVLKDIAGAG